MNNRNRLSI